MNTTVNIIKDRENVNFNGTFSFSLDEMKKAIRTAKKAVTKREDLLDGKLILQVSKLHAAIFSDSWGITAGVYFPIISTDAEFTAILSPEIIAKIEAEKGKKIEAVLRCCCCQIVLEYSGNSFEFENPRCDHYGPRFTYSGDASFSLDADDLKMTIKRTAPITSKDGGRYALTGIYIDADAENEVNFVSTDGCRMSVQRIETAVNIQDRALIEKNTMLKLAKIFDGYKGNIEVNADHQFAYFIGRGITVICSQLSGKFPDWKSGMNQIKDFHRYEIAASEFCKIEPLKNGITPAEPGIVFHKIERLGAIAAAAPAEPEDVVLIGADAPDFPNMKLNYHYVTDFIKNLSSEESFAIQYKTGAAGVLFTAGNWNYLLMPMTTIYIPEEHARRVEYLKKEVKTARSDETRAKNKHAIKSDAKTADIYAAAVKQRERAEKELQATEKMFEESRKKWGEFFETLESVVFKKCKDVKPVENAPETAAAADAVQNTIPTEKAPEKQAEKQETAKEETTPAGIGGKPFPVFYQKGKRYFYEKDGKRVVFTVLGRSMSLLDIEINGHKSTVSTILKEIDGREVEQGNFPGTGTALNEAEPEPMEAPTTEAEPEPAPTPTEPEPEPEPNAEKPFEIGTYTTKKGKVKTAIKFNTPPTPSQIEALKKAYFWEYNGTWNGSPRKLPEIFKH